MSDSSQDQQHPQYKDDRQLVNQLLMGEASDYHLAELARLMIRYDGFPGARDIQNDLQKALARWQLTESELFAKPAPFTSKGKFIRAWGEAGKIGVRGQQLGIREPKV